MMPFIIEVLTMAHMRIQIFYQLYDISTPGSSRRGSRGPSLGGGDGAENPLRAGLGRHLPAAPGGNPCRRHGPRELRSIVYRINRR